MAKKSLVDKTPSQHLIIMVVGGAFVFVNMVQYFKSPSSSQNKIEVKQNYTVSVDEFTGVANIVETRYENPQLSWSQRLFCKGFQRASNCSLKMMHPKAMDAEDYGIKLPDGAPQINGPTYFKGSVAKNMTLSNHIEVPETEVGRFTPEEGKLK